MFNEEKHALAALTDAAAVADEILVVDSFSTDRTPEIVAEFAAAAASRQPELAVRYVQHEYVNSATQKNWAIPQASHGWVMVLDADERIPAELAAEIRAFLAPGGPAATGAADGMRFFRLGYFMGQPVRHSGWQDDNVLRVFPRDRGRYLDREVHADVTVEPARPGASVTVAAARTRMPHYTFDNFEHYMRKFDRYTTWAAGDRGRTTRRVGAVHLLGRPAWRFFRQFVLKRGFLDGRTGMVVCMLAAFSVFLKYAKLWERQTQELDSRAKD